MISTYFYLMILQMAMQAESPAVTPSAQVVGNAFVEQYYHILHQSPELVYRFYQDASVLSRPDPKGVMTSVMTMQVYTRTLSFYVMLWDRNISLMRLHPMEALVLTFKLCNIC